MEKKDTIKETKSKKEENWVDDVMKRQENDLAEEEEILSAVPNRIRHRWLDEDKG